MTIEIKELPSDLRSQWDEYIHQHSESTFFHLYGWKTIIENELGHKSYYLVALENGQIKGVLPLARVKSRLFSDSLISLPFCVYAGVLADNEGIANQLTEHAVTIAKELKTGTLELRHQRQVNNEWSRKSLYVTFKKELDSDNDKNLMAIPRKQRAMVRKGIKKGLVGEEDQSVDRFFEAYSESVHNLGTPVLPKKYFQLLKKTFRNSCRILTIVDAENTLVSSVMSFYFKDEVLPYYGGGKSIARNLAGNDFMYWELMRQSVGEGIKIFDFGRSKEGVGSYRFKKHWGFEAKPLHYEVKLIEANEIPEINPLNPKYQLFIKAWKKMPLPIANLIGPLLARSLG